MGKLFELAFVLGVCACALTGTAGNAQEAKAHEKRVISVRYDDLNLETDQGVRRLYGRLRIAANDVCGVQPGLVLLELRVIELRCVRGAIADAVAKVNRPQLTAFHRTKASSKAEQVTSKT